MDEDDFRTLTRDALRRRRLWLAGIAGNALVALVLLGGPYWRGRERALDARRAFAELGACLWDAEVADDPGLTLPPDDLGAYADAASTPEWPARCVAKAEALAPEAAFWLFPDTRAAEDDLRRARAMILRELRDAPSAVEAPTSIPMRPRLAMLRVAAAVGVLAREADASLDLEAPAFVVPGETRHAAPERVPLRAMSQAQVELRPWAEGVELFALDVRGVSWTRVAGGRVDHRRLRRPALVSGWRRDERGRPWLVWSTREDRCGDAGCARQAIGLAPLRDETVVTPRPRWLAAHPLDGARSVAIGAEDVWVLAATDDGAALRRFAREVRQDETAQDETAQHETAQDATAQDETAQGETAQGETAQGETAQGETAQDETAQDETAPVRALEEHAFAGVRAAVVDVGRVTWSDGATAFVWEDGATRALAAGDRVQRFGALRVVSGGVVSGDGSIELFHDDGRHAVVPMPPSGDLRAVASARVLGAVSLGAERRLRVARCAPACGPWREVARGVHAFDAVALGDAIVVAYVQRVRGAQVVRRIDAELGEPVRPGACFREGELSAEPTGMCGAPLLGASDDRVIVGARDGEDLLVVESPDGRTFAPLRGLR